MMPEMLYEEPRFPMTLKQLCAIEETAGSKLPADARDFLIGLPGVWPSRSAFRFGERTYTDFRFGGNWDYPKGLLIVTPESKCLIIGGSRMRATFALEMNEYDHGAIYLWEGSRGKPPRLMGRVAGTLLDFVGMLEDDPESDFWGFYNKQRNLDGPQWVIDTYHDFEEYAPTYEEQLRLTDPTRLIDLQLTDSGPGVSKDYLDWVELAFRIRLPLDLRSFYSKHNGGTPVETLIKYKGRKVDVDFYSWENPTANNIRTWTEGEFVEIVKLVKFNTRIYPAHHWPLGMTSLPDRNLSFHTGKDHYGSIWLHADTPEGRPVKVADSFAQFVSSTWKAG